MARKIFLRVGVVIAVVFLVLQAHPYGRAHTNPLVRAEPKWDSPATRALAVRACFDCHSNQTEWPWYSYIAPISWAVRHHVDDGRSELNFSEWNFPQEEAEEAAEAILEGEMPLRGYMWLHPKAWLTAEEKKDLIRGIEATFGNEGREQEGRDREKNGEDDRRERG